MVDVDEPGARRSSIEKPPIMIDDDLDDDDLEIEIPAIDRLPDEIIQQILQAADPNSFASLILLNSKWRNASQQAHIYAHQLSRCPSYAASHKKPPNGKQENLPTLRKLFAREVKRNLFDAYLRPNHTVITIVSNSISSSSCPGGEGIGFSPSPKGHHLLAYNSSRIYVIDLRSPAIKVERELKILRRPAATCIKDDGSLLAVLLTEMQVDLYDLTQTPPRRTQSIILDHSPRAIALSPCGSVLAAAYDGGIEVSSLDPGALSTDRRSVKCDAVDALAFSYDGTQILGTTVQSAQPNTVILTAPYYDPGSHISNENISALWTTSILFPNSSRDCSHAVLLQESSHEEAAWTITYDRSFETFRAVRIDDLRNGTTYFTGPIPTTNSQSRLIPCTLPAASYTGELVSAGFQGKEIWLYGLPEDLEAVPENSNNSSENNGGSEGLWRRVSGSSMRSPPRSQEGGEARVPQWQLLCDKYRNTFVGGYKVTELNGVNMVKWIADFGDSSLKERLVIAAKGVMPAKPITEEDGFDFVDGGRLTLVDFDYSVEDGRVTEVTIEVGTQEPEILEEEHRDMETEVAIVRRRTVAQRGGSRSAIIRATTTAARPMLSSQSTTLSTTSSTTPTTPDEEEEEDDDDDDDDPLVPRRIHAAHQRARRLAAGAVSEETETESIIEEQEALDAPYSHTGPRSNTTLRRAATAAATHRRLHPTTAAGNPIVYRRADGRAEHPHESDADNWVPPPPPYQKDDPQDLPAFLRHPATTPVLENAETQSSEDAPPVPPIPQQHRPAPQRVAPPPPLLLQSHSAIRQRPLTPTEQETTRSRTPQGSHHQRLQSYPTTSTPISRSGAATRSTSRLERYEEEEDIYNVSPPDTPHARRPIARHTTNDSSDTSHNGVRRASEPSPSLSMVSPLSESHQRVVPLVPRIQTTAASSPRTPDQPHTLNLDIPSPTLSHTMWNSQLRDNSPPTSLARNSQTWPIPPPDAVASAVLAGYPYSAPPTNPAVNDIMARSCPPPRPEQIASLQGHDGQLPPSRRLSTAFHLPRVPVGSRDGQRDRSPSVQQHLPRPATSLSQNRKMYEPQPQRPYSQLDYRSSPDLDAVTPAPPPPDQPLIISTPKGVSGAFDTPDRLSSDRRRNEMPIVAPVPRHPRTMQNIGLLRPAPERLDVVPNRGQHGVSVSSLLTAPSATSGTMRVSSLNRKQSRAERSAAKNIADAKKRGWRGRTKSSKKKDKGKEKNVDVRSQGGWTDVTYSSAGAGAAQKSKRKFHFGGGGSQNHALDGQEKDKKCVVM